MNGLLGDLPGLPELASVRTRNGTEPIHHVRHGTNPYHGSYSDSPERYRLDRVNLDLSAPKRFSGRSPLEVSLVENRSGFHWFRFG